MPDLTVQSAKTLASSHLKRFPSDLLESSVDPVLPLLSNNPKDFQETQSSTLTETEEEQAATEQHLEPSMVRVYNQPAVTHRGQTPTSSVHLQPQPLNGFQVILPITLRRCEEFVLRVLRFLMYKTLRRALHMRSKNATWSSLNMDSTEAFFIL